ncbi:flagellar hook-basal body complex protein [Motilimonas cestriensis]|uniref:Flagellar hook-basal body complex protein n=1 Tax=Motilimonas cestriensis TaxID=2742685 RepID=A0ABS8WIC0_9GAMM|nr:flagellar hook-basal body complex protein [Motilimonas cestriensis]MCE2597110.1 flagellar hook-basal body complex protein [Motilimonas cestriensis]
MIEALANAELALRAHQKHIDMISHNIANVNTPGFKTNKPVFNAMIGSVTTDNTANPAGAGVELSNAMYRFTDGEYKLTANPLDIAIKGAGLVEVELAGGEVAYTRSGSLIKSQDGSLATSSGHRLSANIIIPSDVTEFEITSDGLVLGRFSGEAELVELGQIELAMFDSYESLKPLEGGLWERTDDAGQLNFARPGEDGSGYVLQGYTELSNVNMIEEMVSLMSAQRAYQLNSRVVQISDQLLETINNLRR